MVGDLRNHRGLFTRPSYIPFTVHAKPKPGLRESSLNHWVRLNNQIKQKKSFRYAKRRKEKENKPSLAEKVPFFVLKILVHLLFGAP